MFSTQIWALGSVSMIGALALFAIVFFRLKEQAKERFTLICTAFACGAMLTNAILNMLPDAVEHGDLGWVLIGMFVSWLVSLLPLRTPDTERCGLCREEIEDGNRTAVTIKAPPKGLLARLFAGVRKFFVAPDKHVHSMAGTIIYAHLFDNFNDGAGIAASFLLGIPHGIQTALSVIMHEIGEEISYFFLLQKWGFSRLGAIMVNFTSAMFALAGCYLVLQAVHWVLGFADWTTGFCGGVFLFIGLSGLVPEMRNESGVKRKLGMVFFVALGFAVVFSLYHFLPE